jgi:diaminopimelate epimerase
MEFVKMHGIGNDFVMIDCMGAHGPAIAAEAERRAAFLCDRKFGIGGDGVILIMPGDNVSFRMRMFNPDGSEAEMCGNGIRCYAKYVIDRSLSKGELDLPVETGAGLLRVLAQPGDDGKVATVRVDMGEPVLTPSLVPTTLSDGPDPVIDQPLAIADRKLYVTTVSMGNPHAVTFVDSVMEYPVSTIGPQVECHPAFPKRTNTEFIAVLSDKEIDFRVWERGAGETLACGTGACAAVVACVLNEKTGRDVLVHLPGGDLQIEWSAGDNRVYMTGAATEVFSGVI